MMKQLVKFLLAILIAAPLTGIVISACSEEDICGSTRKTFVCIPLRQHPSLADSLINDTIPALTIMAAGTDSIILNAQENVKEFELPLQYISEITKLVFVYEEGLPDTVTIEHTNIPFFLSVECGFEIRQEILKNPDCTKHRLEQIVLNKSTVNNDGTPNLYFIY